MARKIRLEAGIIGFHNVGIDHNRKEVNITYCDPEKNPEAALWKNYILDRQLNGYQVYYRQPVVFRNWHKFEEIN